MQKKITSALISVFHKKGIDVLAKQLHKLGITIYATGGTHTFLEQKNIPCIAIENITNYPSILGGRVKTLHPTVFGGILNRRNEVKDQNDIANYQIPNIDTVIVDLYPFEKTLQDTTDEQLIIEKIDIGGQSLIRAAAKNFQDVVVIVTHKDYSLLEQLLLQQQGGTTLEQRKSFAAKAFQNIMQYDIAISNYFNSLEKQDFDLPALPLRYGENPHQQATFFGDVNTLFTKLNGKDLSYNNMVDVDTAIQLIEEFATENNSVFAIIKHTNVCGIAIRNNTKASWEAALSGDSESAFGGVLICNKQIDKATAVAINDIFFEVLIAPAFEAEALAILQQKKNRIVLQLKNSNKKYNTQQRKDILGGYLVQHNDEGNIDKWNEVGARVTTAQEKEALLFANIICKHLKSNAIALVKNQQLIGKGCGQTSRVDALHHAIAKAKQFNFDLQGAVLASDAFFPFSDCVTIAHQNGIQAFIQPGGSVRDRDSINYCVKNNLAMVMTGLRHFKH